MELFWSKGYEATGIKELFVVMGIQRQSFCSTFGSREAIDLNSIHLHIMLRQSVSGQNPRSKRLMEFLHPGNSRLSAVVLSETVGQNSEQLAIRCPK